MWPPWDGKGIHHKRPNGRTPGNKPDTLSSGRGRKKVYIRNAKGADNARIDIGVQGPIGVILRTTLLEISRRVFLASKKRSTQPNVALLTKIPNKLRNLN